MANGPGHTPSAASAAPPEGEAWVADEALCKLLSRLAALKGQAIPLHRFTMRTASAAGLSFADLSRVQQATEQWLACFPEGDVEEAATAQPGDLPALWISRDESRVVLVRGNLSSGAWSAENAAAETLQLSTQAAADGVFLILHTRSEEASGTESTEVQGRSAKQWFTHAISRRRRVFIEGALTTLTVNTLGLMTALYTMQVYDRVVPTQGYATLWVLTVGVLIAVLFELVMKQVRARMVDTACKAIDEELSAVFFGQALAIRMDARPRTVGTFAAQIRHFESVRNFMTSSTLFVLADLPFALIFIGVIWLIAGPVALVPLAMVPLALLAGLAFRRPLARLTESHLQESNRKNGLLIEAIDGAESLKAAGAEWKMLDQWRALTALMSGKELSIRNLSTLGTNLTQTIQQFSYVGLVAAGAFAIGSGNLTVGGLIACTIISGRALSPISQIAGLIVQWQHTRFALQGLDSIMAMPTERERGRRLIVPEQCQGRLRLEQALFSYGQDSGTALSVDQLTILPGERVGIIGTVGSGKTTLLKLLSGLFAPGQGRVLLDEIEIAHLAPEFVREHIGYLPQDVRLFGGTLRENLALGLPSPSDSQILEAARLTGLDRVISAHPRGLGLEISEGGRGLSGGQRQLVGLTRLALAQPKVLLLDEPTASMDGQLESFVTERLFSQLPREHVLVVVTHKTGLLRHFTRLIVVDRGRIVMDGPRDAVLARMREGIQRKNLTPAVVAAATEPRGIA